MTARELADAMIIEADEIVLCAWDEEAEDYYGDVIWHTIFDGKEASVAETLTPVYNGDVTRMLDSKVLKIGSQHYRNGKYKSYKELDQVIIIVDFAIPEFGEDDEE